MHVRYPNQSGKNDFLQKNYSGYGASRSKRGSKHIREFPAGRGFADVVFLPLPSAGKPALVVELKYDKTADAAIHQIKDRRYPQALEGYAGEILLVGINYDRENRNKPHSCVIERVEKTKN